MTADRIATSWLIEWRRLMKRAVKRLPRTDPASWVWWDALAASLLKLAVERAGVAYRAGTAIPFAAADTPFPVAWSDWYLALLSDTLYRYVKSIRDDIGALVVQSAREGWTIPQLTERIQDVTKHAMTYRAERIARTETMRLLNVGKYERMEGVDDIVGYMYDVVNDVRTSNVCRPLRGLRVRREQLQYLPPLHPHCRTTLLPIFSFDDAPEWGDPRSPAPVVTKSGSFGVIPPGVKRS